MWKAEDRRQRAQGRWQKTDGRGRRTEDRRQRVEDRGQKARRPIKIPPRRIFDFWTYGVNKEEILIIKLYQKEKNQ